ncbi:hypothetical protein KIPB_014165, partial [Kipferlia bialata]
DIDADVDLGITTVSLGISDIACTTVSIGATSMTTLAPTQQFQVLIDHFDIDLTFSWEFQEQSFPFVSLNSFPFVSDHGTGTASASDVHGSIIL